jgi:nucleoside phosphorylase
LQEKQVIEIGEHYDAFKKKQEFCSYFTQHKGNLKISMDSKSRDLRIVETGKDISVLNSQEKLTPTKGLSYKEKKISVQGMGNKKTQAIVNAQSSRVRKRAIILTAIEEEFTVVRDYFENYTSEPHPKTKRDYKVGKLISDFFDWDVLLVQTGKFNDNAAAETALAIDHFEPEYVIFIGTAGRIKKDLNIGDILIPELVIGYNYGKANKNEFQISLENIKGPSVPFVEVAKSVIRNKEFMKSFKKVKNKTSWTIFKAYYDKPIASGNITLKDLNAQTAKDIKERFKNAAAAVDMEGIGFLKGCEKFSNIQYILIRSISDFLSNKVAVNKLGSRQVAAENALKMAIEILKNIK